MKLLLYSKDIFSYLKLTNVIVLCRPTINAYS